MLGDYAIAGRILQDSFVKGKLEWVRSVLPVAILCGSGMETALSRVGRSGSGGGIALSKLSLSGLGGGCLFQG